MYIFQVSRLPRLLGEPPSTLSPSPTQSPIQEATKDATSRENLLVESSTTTSLASLTTPETSPSLEFSPVTQTFPPVTSRHSSLVKPNSFTNYHFG